MRVKPTADSATAGDVLSRRQIKGCQTIGEMRLRSDLTRHERTEICNAAIFQDQFDGRSERRFNDLLRNVGLCRDTAPPAKHDTEKTRFLVRQRNLLQKPRARATGDAFKAYSHNASVANVTMF